MVWNIALITLGEQWDEDEEFEISATGKTKEDDDFDMKVGVL